MCEATDVFTTFQKVSIFSIRASLATSQESLTPIVFKIALKIACIDKTLALTNAMHHILLVLTGNLILETTNTV